MDEAGAVGAIAGAADFAAGFAFFFLAAFFLAAFFFAGFFFAAFFLAGFFTAFFLAAFFFAGFFFAAFFFAAFFFFAGFFAAFFAFFFVAITTSIKSLKNNKPNPPNFGWAIQFAGEEPDKPNSVPTALESNPQHGSRGPLNPAVRYYRRPGRNCGRRT